MDVTKIFTESVSKLGLGAEKTEAVVDLANACFGSSLGAPVKSEFSENSESAYTIDFGDDMTALEEEYAFRDGWGHKYASKVVGSKVYYSDDGKVDETLYNLLKGWYPGRDIGTESIDASTFFMEF